MRDWVHEVVDTYITDYELKPLCVVIAGFLLWGVLTGNADIRDILMIFLIGFLQFGVAPWCIGKIIEKIQNKTSATKAADNRRKNAVKVVHFGNTYIFNDSFGRETVKVSGDGKWVVSDHGNWLRMSSLRSNGKQYYGPVNFNCTLDGDIFVGRNNHEYISETGMTREMICAIMLHEAEHVNCKAGTFNCNVSGAVYQ